MNIFRLGDPTEEAKGIVTEFEVNGWDLSIEFRNDGSIEIYGVKLGSDEEIAPTVIRKADDY